MSTDEPFEQVNRPAPWTKADQRRLDKAAAMIRAEIRRQDRAALRQAQEHKGRKA